MYVDRIDAQITTWILKWEKIPLQNTQKKTQSGSRLMPKPLVLQGGKKEEEVNALAQVRSYRGYDKHYFQYHLKWYRVNSV